MFMTRAHRSRGFTLIELIIFIVVVAAGLAGILSVMNRTVVSSADPMLRKQTIAIAESLLEEILLKEYANPPGGDTGTVRALYDDVDQYAGYTSVGIQDPLGVAVSGLGSYNVNPVVVDVVQLGGQTVKRVNVSITGPQGGISLVGYRGNY